MQFNEAEFEFQYGQQAQLSRNENTNELNQNENNELNENENNEPNQREGDQLKLFETGK